MPTTGALQAALGRLRREADGAGGGPYDPNAAPARQFRDVTCIEIAKDGMVYVCDRTQQPHPGVPEGRQVREGRHRLERTRWARPSAVSSASVSSWGSAWDIALSNDPQQRYVFVADGHDKKVIILQRDTLARSRRLRARRPPAGTVPGRRQHRHRFARATSYTGEQHHGKRVQKWTPAGR